MVCICYELIQMKEPLETAELVAFTQAVESGSLSRGAAALGVPRATLGRRLARLEARLGVRLLRRTTRRMALTDAGEAFLHEAKSALAAIERAESTVRHRATEMSGLLRVSAPPGFDETMSDVLCDFVTRHPKVVLEMHFSTAHVDLVRGGFHVAIRAATDLGPGLVARTLSRTRLVAVAAPGYLAQWGTPKRPADLERHRIIMGFEKGATAAAHWPVGKKTLRLAGVLASNGLELQRRAALRGLGIALLPELFVGADIETGALVEVLPGMVGVETKIAIVYPEREILQPHVRAFVDAIASGTKAMLGRRRFSSPS